MELPKNDDGTYPAYAWPGGYPIFYVTKDNSALCPDCANRKNGSLATEIEDPEDSYQKQWLLVAADINYENQNLYCDHCNKQIESAYGET